MRVLIASPIGSLIGAHVTRGLPTSVVAVAVDHIQLRDVISSAFRFDVVVADLVGSSPDSAFDGLDVMSMLHEFGRPAPGIVLTQGHCSETDFLDEALDSPEIHGVYDLRGGVDGLLETIHDVAIGHRLLPDRRIHDRQPLYKLFQGSRGVTAARLAGAIAGGHATDANSLARTAQVGINTANKITSVYLGPIIVERDEHERSLPMTASSIYRWCGIHSQYLISWCRRNGHADVVDP